MTASNVAETVIRPAAVLPIEAAARILAALEANDVSQGGVWNATAGVWQRYDQPWNGSRGRRGDAQLVGSIGVVYDTPRRNQITLYKASLTEAGAALGWALEQLCDDALAYAGLTLADCPREELPGPPPPDPFTGDDDVPPLPTDLDTPPPPADANELALPTGRGGFNELLHTDVRDLLGADVRELVARLRSNRTRAS